MNLTSQAPLILITGGGRGIGAATARLAAERGYDVAISFVSNKEAALADSADVEALGRRALPVCADSADPSRVTELFAAIDQVLGRIDVLVNNAAVLAPQSQMVDISFERMQRIFAMNSTGYLDEADPQVRAMRLTPQLVETESLLIYPKESPFVQADGREVMLIQSPQ